MTRYKEYHVSSESRYQAGNQPAGVGFTSFQKITVLLFSGLLVMGGIGAASDARAAPNTLPGCETGGTKSTQCGVGAKADGKRATAVGRSSDANGDNSTALGEDADATADNSTALGQNARATHQNSTAIGVGSKTTQDDQMMLGTGATKTYTLPGLAGSPGLVTIDNTGNLASDGGLLQTQADANSAGVASNAGAIGTNATNIGSNTTAISQNTALLSGTGQDGSGGLVSQVDTHNNVLYGATSSNTGSGQQAPVQVPDEGLIQQAANNEKNITDNKTSIDENIVSIGKNESNIGVNLGYIEENKANIKTNANEIENNTEGIAMAMAVAGGLTILPEGKSLAVSGNLGLYDDKQALAFSGAARVGGNVFLHGAVGFGLNDSNNVGGRLGVTVAW